MSDTDQDFDDLKRRMLDALAPVVAGSDWAPPDGGVVTEAVVVMMWMDPDGDTGLSFLPATNHFWSTEGLLRGALREHLRADHPAEDE